MDEVDGRCIVLRLQKAISARRLTHSIAVVVSELSPSKLEKRSVDTAAVTAATAAPAARSGPTRLLLSAAAR